MLDNEVEPNADVVKQPKELHAKPTDKFMWRNHKRYLILGIASIIMVCLGLCYIASKGIQRIRQDSYEQTLKRCIESFLEESDKLVLMTEQGVSYDDYKDQLMEVRTASITLDLYWNSSKRGERESFDEALRGWNLALKVWEEKIDKNIDRIPTAYDSLFGISDYLDVEKDLMEHISVEKTIEYLFAKAHQHLDTGRNTITYRLK